MDRMDRNKDKHPVTLVCTIKKWLQNSIYVENLMAHTS